MRSLCRMIGAVVTGAVLFGVVGASAQDWPQWRGPNRDGKAAGFTAPATWPKTLTQKWRTEVGLADATMALVGDKLYVSVREGGNEVALCLNAADGKKVWEDKYAAPAASGPAGSHPGPRSSPAVAEGKVVTLGVTGVVSCLDAATGKVAWRYDKVKEVPQFFAAMSPIIVDGMAIAHLGGKGKGTVIAFDLASGEPKWKWAGDAPTYSSPVLMTVEGTKQLVIQGEKNLQGLGLADGKLLWQVPTPTQGRFYSSATPIIDGQTVIYTGQGRGTKAIKIEKEGDKFAVKELWSNEQVGTGFNTPVLKDGLLYGLSDRSNLYAMSAKDGKELWSHAVARERFGSIVDCGSVLMALPSNSELLVFKPSDKKYEEAAKYKVADPPTYAHPVVSGKRIFVKDKDAVTLWLVE